MVVMSERVGQAPARVEVAGADVWLRRSVEEGEREPEGGGDAVKVFSYEEVHLTDPSMPSVAEVEARFDELWDAHELDGTDAAERIARLEADNADLKAAMLELGDMVAGGEE